MRFTCTHTLKANEYGCLSVVNTKVDGVDGYATSDLFVEHPTKSGYWKVIGRVDDQIIHSTGEKVDICMCTPAQMLMISQTNPGPLGASINTVIW